jgi:hypothetical protein
MLMIWDAIRALRDERFLEEALDRHQLPDGGEGPARLGEDDFYRRLKRSDIYELVVRPGVLSTVFILDTDLLFDTLEYLHAEVVSKYHGQGRYSRDDGQQALRDRINPNLALLDPPLVMLPSGQIVEQVPDELRPLLDDPIPDDVTLPVRTSFRVAIEQYRRRGATEDDKRSALKHLADVLEPMKGEIHKYLLSADESAIFELANKFAIRHSNRFQHRSYDGEVWLNWMFYVYVATARAMMAVMDRDELRDRVMGEPAR